MLFASRGKKITHQSNLRKCSDPEHVGSVVEPSRTIQFPIVVRRFLRGSKMFRFGSDSEHFGFVVESSYYNGKLGVHEGSATERKCSESEPKCSESEHFLEI